MDLKRGEITVRGGKGGKDRVTVLPRRLADPLHAHLAGGRRLHLADLGAGRGGVPLPGALARKVPGATFDWAWQWLFPATRRYRDAVTGLEDRHHLHETAIQRAQLADFMVERPCSSCGGRGRLSSKGKPAGSAPTAATSRSAMSCRTATR